MAPQVRPAEETQRQITAIRTLTAEARQARIPVAAPPPGVVRAPRPSWLLPFPEALIELAGSEQDWLFRIDEELRPWARAMRHIREFQERLGGLPLTDLERDVLVHGDRQANRMLDEIGAIQDNLRDRISRNEALLFAVRGTRQEAAVEAALERDREAMRLSEVEQELALTVINDGLAIRRVMREGLERMGIPTWKLRKPSPQAQEVRDAALIERGGIPIAEMDRRMAAEREWETTGFLPADFFLVNTVLTTADPPNIGDLTAQALASLFGGVAQRYIRADLAKEQVERRMKPMEVPEDPIAWAAIVRSWVHELMRRIPAKYQDLLIQLRALDAVLTGVLNREDAEAKVDRVFGELGGYVEQIEDHWAEEHLAGERLPVFVTGATTAEKLDSWRLWIRDRIGPGAGGRRRRFESDMGTLMDRIPEEAWGPIRQAIIWAKVTTSPPDRRLATDIMRQIDRVLPEVAAGLRIDGLEFGELEVAVLKFGLFMASIALWEAAGPVVGILAVTGEIGLFASLREQVPLEDLFTGIRALIKGDRKEQIRVLLEAALLDPEMSEEVAGLVRLALADENIQNVGPDIMGMFFGLTLSPGDALAKTPDEAVLVFNQQEGMPPAVGAAVGISGVATIEGLGRRAVSRVGMTDRLAVTDLPGLRPLTAEAMTRVDRLVNETISLYEDTRAAPPEAISGIMEEIARRQADLTEILVVGTGMDLTGNVLGFLFGNLQRVWEDGLEVNRIPPELFLGMTQLMAPEEVEVLLHLRFEFQAIMETALLGLKAFARIAGTPEALRSLAITGTLAGFTDGGIPDTWGRGGAEEAIGAGFGPLDLKVWGFAFEEGMFLGQMGVLLASQPPLTALTTRAMGGQARWLGFEADVFAQRAAREGTEAARAAAARARVQAAGELARVRGSAARGVGGVMGAGIEVLLLWGAVSELWEIIRLAQERKRIEERSLPRPLGPDLAWWWGRLVARQSRDIPVGQLAEDLALVGALLEPQELQWIILLAILGAQSESVSKEALAMRRPRASRVGKLGPPPPLPPDMTGLHEAMRRIFRGNVKVDPEATKVIAGAIGGSAVFQSRRKRGLDTVRGYLTLFDV